jgi:hypothetical protein
MTRVVTMIPQEQSPRDKIREEIDNSHRFNSFADQRSQNFVKWYFFMVALKPLINITQAR